MSELIIHDMEQGGESWFAIKNGKVSASNFSKAIGKPGSTRSTYMRKLMAEQLTGEREEGFKNAAMERGIELEEEARLHYENMTGKIVKQVGFVENTGIKGVGVSPDGLIDDDGGFECKCPNSSTHLEYIMTDKVPACYMAQIQGSLWVTGRKYWIFMSYDPRVSRRPEFIKRVERNEDYIAKIQVGVEKFIAEMQEKIKIITGDSPY